jgi:hypothetical protein
LVIVVVLTVTGSVFVTAVAVRTVPGVSWLTVFGCPSMMNCRSGLTANHRCTPLGLILTST